LGGEPGGRITAFQENGIVDYLRRSPVFCCWLAAIVIALSGASASARQVLLIANYGSKTVGKYDAVTGGAINATLISSSQMGLNGPDSLAVDGNNHLFVVTTSNVAPVPDDTIGQFDATTGATINPSFISTSYTFGLATDGHSRLFVPSYTRGVAAYDATTGATNNANLIRFGGGIDSIAWDHNNGIIVPSFIDGTVGRYDSVTGSPLNATLISGLNQPGSVAVDNTNRLFVSYGRNGANNTIGEYDLTTGATLNATLVTSPSAIYAMAVDDNDHLFVVNQAGAVAEYDSISGALLNPSFISGLSTPHDIVFVAAVPEPSSLLLLAAAAGTAAGVCRRRRK
jgi:hypothetical protein